MKCINCEHEMEGFLYKELDEIGMYECPQCDSLHITEECRFHITQILDIQGFKQKTKEFDKQVKQILDEMRKHRVYNNKTEFKGEGFVDGDDTDGNGFVDY